MTWTNQLPLDESVLEHWRKIDEAIQRKEQEKQEESDCQPM